MTVVMRILRRKIFRRVEVNNAVNNLAELTPSSSVVVIV